jgi:hypothetical protein
MTGRIARTPSPVRLHYVAIADRKSSNSISFAGRAPQQARRKRDRRVVSVAARPTYLVALGDTTNKRAAASSYTQCFVRTDDNVFV